jgi:hypothetical protein
MVLLSMMVALTLVRKNIIDYYFLGMNDFLAKIYEIRAYSYRYFMWNFPIACLTI